MIITHKCSGSSGWSEVKVRLLPLLYRIEYDGKQTFAVFKTYVYASNIFTCVNEISIYRYTCTYHKTSSYNQANNFGMI
jgi:hypothetical protein